MKRLKILAVIIAVPFFCYGQLNLDAMSRFDDSSIGFKRQLLSVISSYIESKQQVLDRRMYMVVACIGTLYDTTARSINPISQTIGYDLTLKHRVHVGAISSPDVFINSPTDKLIFVDSFLVAIYYGTEKLFYALDSNFVRNYMETLRHYLTNNYLLQKMYNDSYSKNNVPDFLHDPPGWVAEYDYARNYLQVIYKNSRTSIPCLHSFSEADRVRRIFGVVKKN